MDISPISRRDLLKRTAALLAVVPAAATLSACGSSSSSPSKDGATGSGKDTGSAANTDSAKTRSASAGGAAAKSLVICFSATGHTEAVAQHIAKTTGAGLFKVTPKQPYSNDDLNYNDDDSRVCREHDAGGADVELDQATPDGFVDAEVIYLGYPIWWGGAAWPIGGVVKGNDFSGKTVVPFCTSASSPVGSSSQDLAKMAGTGDWRDGKRFGIGAGKDEVADWAQSLGL